MKKHLSYIFLLGISAMALSVSAQETSRSAYFLDGYSFRHELNPAFSGERNYISMPVLGNFSLGTQANIGVNTFLYKMPDGQLTTFMNSSVSAGEFLDNIKDKNRISAYMNMTLLSAGFKGFGGYNTVTIGTRANVGLCLPKGLFEFMKLGQTGPDTRYSFKDLSVNTDVSAEIALGHSRRITDKIEVGAKAKVLLGLGNLEAKINKMDVVMSDNKWVVSGNGELNMAAGSGLKVPTKQEAGKEYDNPSQATEVAWDDIDYDSFGLSGFGLGFDLGATYQLLPDLKLSAAVLDLGFMNWSNNINAKTPTTTWTFDGFSNVALDSSQPGYEDNKIGEQFDQMWDDLQDAINFHKTDASGSRTTALAATVHIGAEYNMPFYKNLTGGLLLTSRFNGPFTWYEGRLSANVKPVKWFDASVNFAQSSFGSSFGWMLNFHPKGVNFFIGSDHQFFRVTPQYVPVSNANMALNLGLNVTFGSRS